MYLKDENDENNKININNYKNILYNKKKNTGLLNQHNELDKRLNYIDKKGNKTLTNNGENNMKYSNIKENIDNNIYEENEDDSDEEDEDYKVDEDEEEEEEDDFDVDEYDEEEIDLNFNSYNNYYYEAYNEDDSKNEIDETIKNKNREEKINNEEKIDNRICEKYNNLLANNRFRKQYDMNIELNKRVTNVYTDKSDDNKSASCYSCKSEDRIKYDNNINLRNNHEINSEDGFIYDVLDRIDDIYYKESKYKNLKTVNNYNNNVCINDLNLNLISDYLNVDISVFHKKTTVLLLGNTQSGKSSFINWFSENYVQNTSSIHKHNQITYVDIKNNFKFNFKKLNNDNYQFGLLSKFKNNNFYDSNKKNYELSNENKKIIFSGENCDYLFKPFQKLRKKAHNIKKYIYGKIYYQNNLTKYMNRVNSVSFIDTSGINESSDVEYDEIIMNLSKYVDLIFIFIDSNKYSINTRLLRIINYIIDNQINKVTMCLTRIDLMKKINLYRVVFYLTQYFLRNLNIFKINSLDDYCNSVYKNNNIIRSHNKENSGKSRNNKIEKINIFFNKSIKSFQNILLFPKLLTKMISNKNIDEKKNTFLQSNNYNNYFYVREDEEKEIKNNSMQFKEKSSNSFFNSPRGSVKSNEGIFKKIMTKSYSSFKEKIMNTDSIRKINSSTNNCYQEEFKYRGFSYKDNNENIKDIVNSKYEKLNNSFDKLNENYNESKQIYKDSDYYCSNKSHNYTKNNSNNLYEKKVHYGDCIKNLSIFFFVLIYEVMTTICNLIYTSVNNYFNPNETKFLSEDNLSTSEEENKSKYNHNNSYKILEFLTIYLPEIPCDLFKREKWKYDESNLNYNNNRRNRFSCNMQYENNDYNEIIKTNTNNNNNPQRRSIPVDFILLDKTNNYNKNIGYVNNNNFSGLNEITRNSIITDSDFNNRNSNYVLGNEQRSSYFAKPKNFYPFDISSIRMKNDDVKDLNMIQELLFRIDESIDLKTNQSIYMLKKDLQKIQDSCLKKISDNNEIIKKNKSLRIQKIKFYFFKYMAILFGFLISLLRYDLLVYFNFIKPELLFSIFSKYFLFLSSYNKNSIFITINIILIVTYFILYFRYNKRNYFKSLDKSDLNKLKIILLFTQIIFDEINQLHLKLLGKKIKDEKK
ncbi:conserved Plasmodium protein, unknown function [Plasmodium gallinaceum]|uniref:Dynamin N-terminal domain-containing protein n=1 Tax=Plasmodium gallinaceum TaxID=5849 RepID=A0A1J1GP20_PLAGA|nr:conserved Plasmodium protein, unknown function [Plasmodium gallinaceum]CRG94233.1 conserved Plasmodium protein, unknown function [Plasmodium gallinaceum]